MRQLLKIVKRRKYIKYIKKQRESIAFFAVGILAASVSVISFLYFSSHGLTLSYGDGKAHLNIARRVIFSLNPGITQLGGIWLPLPHMLYLLTIWNNFMYYSGLSGSMISMISYVIAVLVVYKSVYFYTKSLVSAILGSCVMLLSPSFLYFQTTPMTELPSIALSLIAMYLLIKWSRSNNLPTLLLAAFFAAVSSLSRYDNWFLVITSFFVITLVAWLKNKDRKIAESSIVIFATLASFGIFLWLLYNLLIFGNPLNFALGTGSASWFATTQHAATRHNVYLSISTFTWLMIDTIGLITFVLMIVGIGLFLLKKKFHIENIPAYLFLAPIIFNIISLFFGQSIAYTQHLPPYQLYNTRYGLNALAAASFFIGTIHSHFKKSLVWVVPLMMIQYVFLFSSPTTLPVIRDNGSIPITAEMKAAEWLRIHPANGLTLISASSLDRLIFDAQISQRKMIYEGSGIAWKESLNNPKKYASRIITGKNVLGTRSDTVGEAVQKSREFETHYHKVFSNSYITVYDSAVLAGL